MSRRRAVIYALVGIAIAVVGFLFISAIVRQSVSPPPPPTQPPPITLSVVVSKRSVPIRALLTADDLAVVQVPIEYVPLEALSDLNAAIGKITKIPMVTGEMVLKHHLADPTNIAEDLAFVIGDDQVLMTFPAVDLMSRLNILQPGDLVDIFVSIEVPVLPPEQEEGPVVSGPEAEPEKVLFTFDALQRIHISAIVVRVVAPAATSGVRAGATPEPTATPQITPLAIVLALAPQDALVLKHLQDAGGIIDIVLRAPTSQLEFRLQPVTSDYLKDRYELVISP